MYRIERAMGGYSNVGYHIQQCDWPQLAAQLRTYEHTTFWDDSEIQMTVHTKVWLRKVVIKCLTTFPQNDRFSTGLIKIGF